MSRWSRSTTSSTRRTNALLFKHDSTYGAYPGTVEHTDDALIVDGREIKVFEEKDPAALPWGDLGVDIVLESTGKFRTPPRRGPTSTRAPEGDHQRPAKGEDITIVLGVNEGDYDPAAHHIISNASCTTNCLAPAVKVVNDAVGIKRGLMNTIHSYTNDQRILDVAHKDPRRARAAGQNIIPTTTGAAKALALVIPELAGRFDGFSLRVPTPTVSVVDFTADIARPTSVEELNDAFRAAAAGPMKGILGVSDEPLVSMDFKGDAAVLDHRRRVDHGHRRHAGQGHRLVRQRVGLQLPHRRPPEPRGGAPARSRLGPSVSRQTGDDMNIQTIRDVEVAGRRVFVRVDFNVPMAGGEIADNSRIRRHAAHDPQPAGPRRGGRPREPSRPPEGAIVDPGSACARSLSGWASSSVVRSNSSTIASGSTPSGRSSAFGQAMCCSSRTFASIRRRRPTSPAFAAELASFGDVFVNDAFATAHRAHASTVGVAALLPAYCGLLMEREIDALSSLLTSPQRPFVAILGGAKVSDKFNVIGNLLTRVDVLVLGGGMANTFLLAGGAAIGASLAEPDRVAEAGRLLQLAYETRVRVVLPIDVRIGRTLTPGTEVRTCRADDVPDGWHILDIGPETLGAIGTVIAEAQTVFWNGPSGCSSCRPSPMGRGASLDCLPRRQTEAPPWSWEAGTRLRLWPGTASPAG